MQDHHDMHDVPVQRYAPYGIIGYVELLGAGIPHYQ